MRTNKKTERDKRFIATVLFSWTCTICVFFRVSNLSQILFNESKWPQMPTFLPVYWFKRVLASQFAHEGPKLRPVD